MKGLARRPSPAMVVALIALVCALTGTAWAALGKNSVGSKQLKSNAVTTAKIKKESVTAKKIKKGTITGTQINLAKLGTVPSAQLANTIPPAEATHVVGTPGQPGFEDGSKNAPVEGAPFGFNSVGFYKDHEGIVHLEGVAESGAGPGGLGIVFTLPPGFRPAANKIIPWNLSTFQEGKTSPGGEIVDGSVESGEALIIGSGVTVPPGIDLSGKVVGEAESLVILDGLTYRAEG
jgi:hypothetical protein